MGIRIREILENEYFRDFKVLAGHSGLDRQFQGFAVFEAPDSFNWAQGRELVFSSGFLLAEHPELTKELMASENFQKMAGFMIKLRYIKEVPQHFIHYFDERGMPLIVIPDYVPWMELMNQVHVMVINRNMQRFRISAQAGEQNPDSSYQERKIHSILQAVESEMGFPALVYDLGRRKAYYSSSRFRQDYPYPFQVEDFWAPSFSYSRHLLCPTLQMARYRFREEDSRIQPPFSWITVPISVGSEVKAYFVILESRDLIDYYDQFAVRIAVLLLQAVYEQITVAQSLGDVSFESFVHFALQQNTPDPNRLLLQANAMNLRPQKNYYFALVERRDESGRLADCRQELQGALRRAILATDAHCVLLDEERCLLLLSAGDSAGSGPSSQTLCKELLRFANQLEQELPSGQFCYSVYDEKAPLLEVKQALERCRRAMELGPALYPKEKLWRYRQLGAFAWLNVPPEEMDDMFREFLPILRDEKNAEDIQTLKVYLENNMNFSATAEKMYLHINTVRKRIDRALNLFPVDWEDHMARMKLELMLQLLRF